jgi:O-Antigen ligase
LAAGTVRLGAARAEYDEAYAIARPRTDYGRGRPNYLAVWLILVGLILPAWEMHIFIAGSKFTVGRMGVTLLFLPAFVAMFRPGRRLLMPDFLAFSIAIWMIIAKGSVAGSKGIFAAGATSLEFIAGYWAARAFIASPAALDAFVRVLKFLTMVAVALAMLDTISGRWLSHDVAAAIFGNPVLGPVFRGNMIRATSTFDHPILFGVFCGSILAIVLFWEKNALKRIFFTCICFVGCFLSQSSAALMCFGLTLLAYVYERLLQSFAKRWLVFWLILAASLTSVFLVTTHPVGWLVSHLTLDPESGYFRMLIWDAALAKINDSPLFGYTVELFGDEILDATVDSVWLVDALRFGIPAVVLLILVNIAAILPIKGMSERTPNGVYIEDMHFAFTIVLVLFMFAGITVHFWNYSWIFWGICLGIAASLREMACNEARLYGGSRH